MIIMAILTKEELIRVGTLMGALGPSQVADILELTIECSECPFGGEERECPYLNEIEELGENSDKTYRTSCSQVLTDYILTGQLVDKRKEDQNG